MARLTIHGTRRKAWADIHKDYKSIIDGTEYVLTRDEEGATVLMPYKTAKERNLI